MKNRKVVALFIACLLLASCNQYESIQKDKVITDTIEVEKLPIATRYIKEKDIKTITLEALQNYFSEDVSEETVKFQAITYNSNDIFTKFNEMLTIDDYLVIQMDYPDLTLGTSYYSVSVWDGHKNFYMVDIDTKTGNVLSVLSDSYLIKQTENKDISLHQAKNRAVHFIKDKKLAAIKEPKLVKKEGQSSSHNYNRYKFLFEDRLDKTKKVLVTINSMTGKVESFAINYMTIYNLKYY